ncbi:MAG: hypothetical protein JNK23_12555 [Opitutaceae bacterium]|nr:hypothetical protein [Opitutaceae bacterium]
MKDAAARSGPAWLDTSVLTLASGLLVIAAAMAMFSTFMFYDDEGYVLLSLKNFSEHSGLYRDVYTQYGPFPFVTYHALQLLGVPLTHTVGRVITLGAWAGTAWACMALVGHATRSLVVRLAVLAAVFVYLWAMANEPSHPGGLIVFLTALLALLGYRWIERGQWTPWAILAGAIAAALLLTKINVGVFAVFSTGVWWLLHTRVDALRRWAPAIVAAAGVVLPLGLMRALLGAPWVQDFALVFGCSMVATALAVGVGATGRVGWRPLAAGAAAAGGVALVVLGAVMLCGTTPRELLEGILLGPLRHPVVFSVRYDWPSGIAFAAVISATLCAGAWLLRRRGHAWVDTAVAGLRLVAAAGLAVSITRYPILRPEYLTFGWMLPCVWLFAWPLAGTEAARNSARAWIALLLIGQTLHVFPVPGSQIGWGSVLFVPLVALGAWEAATWLARRGTGTWLAARSTAFAATAALALFCGVTAWNFGRVAARYTEGQSLGLPGAEAIRLPDHSAALFRVLTHNAVAHADVLFSLPGAFSFNLLTGLPTPTLANATHWFSLLDETRQQAIIRKLEAHPRAGLIVQPGQVKFLVDRNMAPKGPLHDYVRAHYEAVFGFDEVEFHVRRGRKIAPFLVAELLTLAEGAAPAGAESSLLRLALLTPPAQPIARVEILSRGPEPIVLDASNARLETAPASVRGEPAGPARPAAWPAQPGGPAILNLFFHGEKLPAIAPGATLVLRDAAGREVGLARLAP